MWIFIVISFLLFGLLLYLLNKYKLLLNNKLNNYIDDSKKKIELELIDSQNKLNEINNEISIKEQSLIEKTNLIKEEEQLLLTAKQSYSDEVKRQEESLTEKKKLIDEAVSQIEMRRNEQISNSQSIIDETLHRHFDSAKREYEQSFRQSVEDIRNIMEAQILVVELDEQDRQKDAQQKLDKLKAEVADWQKKRDAINQEILRSRAVNEQQDFYRVCISGDDIADIHLLQEMRSKLSRREALDKLIYDGYIAKPVLEMTKRVLGGKSPSGIYKITRLKTGEVYVGRSADVASRFKQHAKTCFNVGDIAHSILHTTMQRDGIDQFTFELLEECPKEKLGEREKFYINLYNSKTYGLNEREGG